MDEPFRHRLGTTPPAIGAVERHEEPDGLRLDAVERHEEPDGPRLGEVQRHEEPDGPRLGLSVRLDRPFHELKEFLLAEFERAYLLRCLTESEMNVSAASRQSGLSRKHLRTLMSKYGIRRGEAAQDHEGE